MDRNSVMSIEASKPICQVRHFMERDVDIWLAEELRVNAAFGEWFSRRARVSEQIVFPAERTQVSVMGENGETDVEATFCTSDGRRYALLIENKLEHSLKAEQLSRYRLRGQYGVNYGYWDAFTTVVVAPGAKLLKHTEAIADTPQISFEEIASSLLEGHPNIRIRYRAQFLMRAASEQHAAADVEDRFRIEFWKGIYHALDEKYPNYFALKRDSYPKTTYIAANCVGSPHYFRIDLKGTKGEVDIAFKNIGTGDLIRFLEDRKPKISNVVLNKQSIALQISGLPSFFVRDGILSAKESAMKSFEAAHQLLEFWKQNRAFFDNHYERQSAHLT